MTGNQIAYANYVEKQRNDREIERLRKAELEESKRATDLARDTNLRSIEAGILNVQKQSEASKYAANQSAGASIYSANTQREIANINVDAQAQLRESQANLNVASTAQTKASTIDTYVNTGTKIGKAIGAAYSFVKNIFGKS